MGLTEKLTAIGDGFRSSRGLTEKFSLDQMAAMAAEWFKLQAKTVTPTGKTFTVNPDDGYDGFSAVTVAVDASLAAENILAGVTIFGVTGTAESGGGGSALETCTVAFETDGWATEVGYYEVSYDDSYGDSAEAYSKAFTTQFVESGSKYEFTVLKNSVFMVGTESEYSGYVNTEGDCSYSYDCKVGTVDVFDITGDCTIWDGYY